MNPLKKLVQVLITKEKGLPSFKTPAHYSTKIAGEANLANNGSDLFVCLNQTRQVRNHAHQLESEPATS